jgi:predicted alpha/beta-hydrolase family hydrolase
LPTLEVRVAVIQFLFDGPEKAKVTLALAHGAGAGMDTPFMNLVAAGLAERGVCVARFEFPYMAARRQGSGRRGPDGMPVLLATWHEAVAALRPQAARLAIGGKSMGGRIASMIADEAQVAALVCLGYPFHPPGKPSQLRVEHLSSLATPALILQGTRDPFGTREEVAKYKLSRAIEVRWIEDGDHSFKPRPRTSGRSEAQNLAEAVAAIATFLG